MSLKIKTYKITCPFCGEKIMKFDLPDINLLNRSGKKVKIGCRCGKTYALNVQTCEELHHSSDIKSSITF